MDTSLRRQVMTAEDERLIYLGRNLICDGTNFFDTGFAPFSNENQNVDFRITIRFNSLGTVSGSNYQDSIITCKYEGTLSGQSYPGFLIRRKQGSGNVLLDIGGYNYWTPSIAETTGKTIYFWRKSGNYYAMLEGNSTIQTLSVRTAIFDQNILIGAAQQTNGTKFRYGQFNIEYIRIEYLKPLENDEPIEETWTTLKENEFNTYFYRQDSGGNPFTVQDDGDWILIVSNGQNKNATACYAPRASFVYNDLKDKTLKFTWNIESDDYETLNAADWSGNISFGLFNTTSGIQTRVSKLDIATKALGNFLGTHTIEFVPSELFAGMSTSTYFGWNIGFRSSTNGDTIRIKEIKLEIKDE